MEYLHVELLAALRHARLMLVSRLSENSSQQASQWFWSSDASDIFYKYKYIYIVSHIVKNIL